MSVSFLFLVDVEVSAQRTAWTTSRITGSPEPPPPFRAENAFPHLSFVNPLLITHFPGSDRLMVGEQRGRIYSFPNDPACNQADLFIDLAEELQTLDQPDIEGVEAVYGLAFHPKFAENRLCYICYVVRGKPGKRPLPDGTRVSQFRVTDTDPPRCDPSSEKILITWLAGGHNGGCLKFGPDGYLYITTGDATAPNPPDVLDTGQDLTDLLSSILRIDVDHSSGDKPYSIPPDNPFIKTPNARPEIWAYGFRNPWKMSFDPSTGDLWVGDVGWELWEMVYRVERGGNYGWPVMEGRQPIKPDGLRGPTPIIPPTLEYPHTEGASITGGYVYHGKRLPELRGAYICGDYVTRKMWAAKFEGKKLLWHKEIAQTAERIVAFGEDREGEIYYLHHDPKGTIHKLVLNEVDPEQVPRFPRKLSGSGLFRSVTDHQLAPGVIPFSINAEQWMDHARAERFIGLPGTSSVTISRQERDMPNSVFRGRVWFPRDGVLAKTISMEMEAGNPSTSRRLETQILHFNGDQWNGYTYRWNDEQTDAELVPASGDEMTFTVRDPSAPGGQRVHRWHFHARGECMQCHNPWADYGLAFTPAQLDRPDEGNPGNQLKRLRELDVVKLVEMDPAKPLVNPFDDHADLNDRARSYLHVNCAHCHQNGAGGSTTISLRHDLSVERMQTIDAPPTQGDFHIPDARVVTPGDPYRSVLFYRMAKLGRGRMPHIGSDFVDERGLRLIHEWIRGLPLRPQELTRIDRLRQRTGQRFQAERQQIISELLASPNSALRLAHSMGEKPLPKHVQAAVLASAKENPDAAVRDLFQRFLPDSERVKTLGTRIDPLSILRLKGDESRGRAIFFDSTRAQCIKCHRVGDEGVTIGPELSDVVPKLSREELLDNLIHPSKNIDPKFQSFRAETVDGRLLTGLLVEKSAERVILKDAEGKEVKLPAEKVEALTPLPTSLMPEQLLRDLTAQEAADLLAYLRNVKKPTP